MGRRNKKSSKRTPKTPFEAVDKTEWEVEAIHAKRWAKGVLQYEVKWKDHVDKDNTWEPLENLVGAELSISDFEDAWEKNYNAPRKEKRTRQTATSCATPLEEAQSEADESLDSTIRQAVDLAETLAAGESYALSLMSGPITEHVILPSTVEAREPVLAVQIPNVASFLRDLRCQLTAKADARLRTWISETMECIHSKALKAKAYESCADRKFRVHLELGKKCESSTMSAWLGERKTMWRGLRRLSNSESSTSAEEDKCDPTVVAESRPQKQMSTNEGPKAKRKKPSGAKDSKKKKAKYTTASRKKSIGNVKMKKSWTRTSRPKVNVTAACRLQGSRCKGSRLSKRRLPTSSRKGGPGSGSKRKRLFVDTEERKTPRPKTTRGRSSRRDGRGSESPGKVPVLENWVQCSDCSKVRASVKIPSKGTSCAASLQLRFHFTNSYPILYLVDCSISGGASSGPSTPRAFRGGGTAASTRWTPRTLRATRPRRTRRSRGGTSNRARRRRRFTTSIRSTRDCRTSGDVAAAVEEEEEVVRSRGSRPRRLRVA